MSVRLGKEIEDDPPPARCRGTIRQWKLLRLMCASRYVTVHKAAERLQVSTKTIRRDLSALEAAGFPLYYHDAGEHMRFLRLNHDWFLSQPRRTTDVRAHGYR